MTPLYSRIAALTPPDWLGLCAIYALCRFEPLYRWAVS